MIHAKSAWRTTAALGTVLLVLGTAVAEPGGKDDPKKGPPKTESKTEAPAKVDKDVEAWVKILGEKMTDRHDVVRESARAALAAIGRPALPGLKKLADSDDGATATAAHKIIAQIEGRRREAQRPPRGPAMPRDPRARTRGRPGPGGFGGFGGGFPDGFGAGIGRPGMPPPMGGFGGGFGGPGMQRGQGGFGGGGFTPWGMQREQGGFGGGGGGFGPAGMQRGGGGFGGGFGPPGMQRGAGGPGPGGGPPREKKDPAKIDAPESGGGREEKPE